jgi:F0F1-type ATP synthase assembly protein I
MTVQNKKEEPKLKKIVEAADGLSLGISMVVAVLIGVAIGLGLRNLTGAGWTLWIGVFIGVGAAILNVYKAYAKQKRSLDELANDPRYTYKKEQQEKYDAEDEDDKY